MNEKRKEDESLHAFGDRVNHNKRAHELFTIITEMANISNIPKSILIKYTELVAGEFTFIVDER